MFKNMLLQFSLRGALAITIASVAMLPIYVAASPMSWNVDKQFDAPSHYNETDLMSLQGDTAYVNNELGFALLKINSEKADQMPAGGNNTFSIPWGESAVYAKYEPETSTGVIFVTRAIRLTNGDGIIESAQWKPANFDIYKEDFAIGNGALCKGINPFAPYKSGNGVFTDINFPTFQVAVGMVMQHIRADKGWIAFASTRTEKTREKHGGFFHQSVTVKFRAYTKPTWLIALPNTSPVGKMTSVSMPVASSTQSQIDSCIAMNPRSLGQASTDPHGNGAIHLVSGVKFIKQGDLNNLPDEEIQTFYHEKHKGGFGSFGLAMVLGGMLFGAIGAIPGLVPDFIDETFFYQDPNWNVPGGTGFASVLDNVNKSTPHRYDPDGDSLIGEISTMNLAGVVNQAYSGGSGNTETHSDHAEDPYEQKNEWDPYPSVARIVTKGFGQTGGGFAAQSDNIENNAGKLAGKTVLSIMQGELGATLKYNAPVSGG